jgi:hypothetical protein
MFRRDVPLSERVFKGSRYSLLALGREEAKYFVPEAPYLIVSISDPDKPEPEIPSPPHLRGVLRLRFHDVGQPRRFQETADVAMTPDQARQILTFVREHLSGTELIVCQCEQGVSRSAAVAAALSRILQGEDEYFFKHFWPNRWVYNLLLGQSQAEDDGRA